MVDVDLKKPARQTQGQAARNALQTRLIKWSDTTRSGREFLWHLLDYEIRGALRYRRFLSLLLLDTAHHETHFNALLDVFRSSDEWIRYDRRRLAIIMRETDPEAARVAIQRALAGCGAEEEFKIAVVSYPADGWNGRDLLEVAERRLVEAESPAALQAECDSA